MNKKTIMKTLNICLYLFYFFSIFYFINIKIYRYSLICVGCIIGTFLLGIINKKYNKFVNDKFLIVFEIFILLSLILGTCYGMYKVNHYDDFLHISSGVIGSVVGCEVLKIYLPESKRNDIKKIFFIIFIFTFSMSIGGLWEILEFSLDCAFRINCQAGGLNDTVVDMIDALIGTIITIPILIKKL